MNILLDTCAFIYITSEPKQLSKKAATHFQNPDNKIYLSSISVWEIIVKTSLGKLQFPVSAATFIPKQRELYDIETLPFNEIDCLALGELKDFHKDPFDRMLICQALNNDLSILTPDNHMRKYKVKTIW